MTVSPSFDIPFSLFWNFKKLANKVGWTNGHFSCLNQVSMPNVKKDEKNGKYTFLPSLFKAPDVADIYEYVLDLEATC